MPYPNVTGTSAVDTGNVRSSDRHRQSSRDESASGPPHRSSRSEELRSMMQGRHAGTVADRRDPLPPGISGTPTAKPAIEPDFILNTNITSPILPGDRSSFEAASYVRRASLTPRPFIAGPATVFDAMLPSDMSGNRLPSMPRQTAASGPSNPSSHVPTNPMSTFPSNSSSSSLLPQAEQINPAFRFGSLSIRPSPHTLSSQRRTSIDKQSPSFLGTPSAELGPYEWPLLTPSGSSEGLPTSPLFPVERDVEELGMGMVGQMFSPGSSFGARRGSRQYYGIGSDSLAPDETDDSDQTTTTANLAKRGSIMLDSPPMVQAGGGVMPGRTPAFSAVSGASRRGSTMSHVPLYHSLTDTLPADPPFPLHASSSTSTTSPSMTSYGARRPSVIHSTTVPQFPLGTPAVLAAKEAEAEAEEERLRSLVNRAERMSLSLGLNLGAAGMGSAAVEGEEESGIAKAARIRRSSNTIAEMLVPAVPISNSRRGSGSSLGGRQGSLTGSAQTTHIRDRRRSSTTSPLNDSDNELPLPLSIELPPSTGFRRSFGENSSSGGSTDSIPSVTSSTASAAESALGGSTPTSKPAPRATSERRRPSLLLYTHQPPKEGPIPPSLANLNLRRGSLVTPPGSAASALPNALKSAQPAFPPASNVGRRGSLAALAEGPAQSFRFGTAPAGPASGSAVPHDLMNPSRRLSLARGEGMLISNYGGPDEHTTVSAAYLYNRRGSLGIGLGIGGSVITQNPAFGKQEIIRHNDTQASRPSISPFQPDSERTGARAFGSISGESTDSRSSLSSHSTIKDLAGGSQETVYTRKASQELGSVSPAIDARLQEYMSSSARGRMSMPLIALKHSPTGAAYARRDSEELLGGVSRTFGMLPGAGPSLTEGATSRPANISGSPRLDGSPRPAPTSPASPGRRTRRLGSGSSIASDHDSGVYASPRRASLVAGTPRTHKYTPPPPAALRTLRHDSSTTNTSSFSSGSSRLSMASSHSLAHLSSSGSEGEKEEAINLDTLRRIRHSNAERRRSSRISVPQLATVGETAQPMQGSALSSGSGSESQEEEVADERAFQSVAQLGRGTPAAQIHQAFESFSFPAG